MSSKDGCVYIRSNKHRTTLYIVVTNNLVNRVNKRKNEKESAFITQHKCYDLLYYEFFDTIEEAVEREKALKKWNRSWKEDLIKGFKTQLLDHSYLVEDIINKLNIPNIIPEDAQCC